MRLPGQRRCGRSRRVGRGRYDWYTVFDAEGIDIATTATTAGAITACAVIEEGMTRIVRAVAGAAW